MIEHRVEPSEAGLRLDRFLAGRHPAAPRQALMALLAAHKVRVNGRLAAKGQRLAAGDRVLLAEAPGLLGPPAPSPELVLTVLHEDAEVLVIDKPAGVPTQPLRAGEGGTLAGAVLARYPETAGLGEDPREPGLVHRLDVGTSGALLVARTPGALAVLQEALGRGEIDKQYLALAAGDPRGEGGEERDHELMIDRPIGHGPRGSGTMVSGAGRSPREARTRVKVLGTAHLGGVEGHEPELPVTLVEVHTETGRMHQVRVHLAWAGAPLVGDPRYGGPALPDVPHPALHAAGLRFVHPRSGRLIEVRAPLPAAMRELLERCRPSLLERLPR